MSDELTSAMNAYLSHYPDATDDLKKGIADALIDNIKRSIPNQSFGTFSSGPDDKKSDDKIRFVQEYLKSIGMTPTRVESYANSGTRMVHFERANQSPQDLVGSTQSSGTFADHVSKTVDRIAAKTVRLYGIGSNPQALSSDLAAITKMASMKGEDNHISFADVATESARFVPAPTSSLYGGNGQAGRWELGLDHAVASGILDQIKLNPLEGYKEPSPAVSHPHPAYGKRRLSTSARAASAAASMPAVLNSGNVTPGATFQPFQPTGEVPDLNNPPRFTPQTQTGSGGRPPLPPTGEVPDLNNPPRFDHDISDLLEDPSLNSPVRYQSERHSNPSTADRAAEQANDALQTVQNSATSGGSTIQPAPQLQTSGQQPPRPPLPPWWETADLPTVEERQQSTADRAAQHAEEARRIVEDIAMSGGGRIPPAPPGGNDPPGPPDEPEDDDNILNRLLEFFQRMFGVRPGRTPNRSFLDTLANNLTSILGGVPPQPAGDGQQPSAITTLMDTVADYFNVPRETEDATRQAQETLRRSIDRLTDATNAAANGGTPTQPQGRFARFRSFFRRGRGRRGGIATATRIASFIRPVLSRIGNIVPARWRNAAAQAGVNMVTQVGGRFGVPAATAARFGAALGPAAIGIGVLAYGIPLVGAAIKATISGLNKLAESALQTTFALANYSGLLAHANAQLEVNREMRKFDMANRMGALGAERLNQVNRLENAMQPWKEAGNQVGNLFGTAVDAVLSTILEAINTLIATELEVKAAILQLIPGDQGEAMFRKEAERLRNPGANLPQAFEGREAMFGQNAVDMIDLGKRLAGPRRPVNGGN